MKREEISQIVKGGLGYTVGNFFEDTTYFFSQLQSAVLKGYDINLLCFDLCGEILQEIMRLESIFGIKPKRCIIYKQCERNEIFNCIEEKKIPIIEKKTIKNEEFGSNDYFLICWDYSVRVIDVKSFIFKVNRFLNRKFPNWVDRHNPYSRKMDEMSHNSFLRFNRPDDYKKVLYYKNHVEDLERIYAYLEDEISKNTFVSIIKAICECDKYRGYEGRPDEKYWDCYIHLQEEFWINCGACCGDTIMWFLFNKYPYYQIDAYEGDKDFAEKMKKNIDGIGASNIIYYNEYIGTDSESANDLEIRYSGKKVTLINMDIEGAELNVLIGLKKLIKRDKPVLAICAYHKPEDLIELVDFIKLVDADYHVYLRKYSNGGPVGVTEYVYYFVPTDRKL